MKRISKQYILDFIFKQKCIPWGVTVFRRKMMESRRGAQIRFNLNQMIIRPAWIRFLIRNAFFRKLRWRIGFISDEFAHSDLMLFGGHGMTLKLVTDYLNNSGLLKADVLMCNTRDITKVHIKRYHSADLIFLPQHQSLDTYFQCSHVLRQRGINVFVGVDHRIFYEYFLKSFPYIPWVIWIKAPRNRKIWEKISTVPLELKTQHVRSIEDLIIEDEEDAESLRRMIKISRSYGRKIYFGAESNYLAEIARRKYGLGNINAFHWPNPIPLPDIAKATFSEKPSFLLLGRLDPIKRPWIFFELAKRFKDADFYVAGTPHHPEIMGPVIAKFKEVPNLRFMGVVQGKDKAALLGRVWAVVNTSIHEGVPVSVLEGFSYGKPAIAALDPDGLVSRYGIYVGEVYGDGDDTESLDRLSSAVEKVISGKLDKEKLGQQSRQYIANVHSFEYFEKTLLDVLNSDRKYQYRY